jgi:FtsP/CotA-like multicopper oxidase with cupredoxin domain
VLPVVQPNRNVERAGVLREGVLTVTLEAKESRFWIHGPNWPATAIEAFSEPGREPQMPGPLVRVPVGTEIRLSVRNSLAMPLTFFVSAAVGGGSDRVTAPDSIVVVPGTVGQLVMQAKSPGNYVYRATTPNSVKRVTLLAGGLGGALVVDTAGAPARPNDRVFVIMTTPDSGAVAQLERRVAMGRSGPKPRSPPVDPMGSRNCLHDHRPHTNTERDDRWRFAPLASDQRIRWSRTRCTRTASTTGWTFDDPGADNSVARAAGWSSHSCRRLGAMSMTWSPDRPGNWVFHCHFTLHNMPDSMSAAPNDPRMRGMAGLILGVNVAGRRGVHVVGTPALPRHLRLVATIDSLRTIGVLNPSGRYIPEPSMRFVVEHGRRSTQNAPSVPSSIPHAVSPCRSRS